MRSKNEEFIRDLLGSDYPAPVSLRLASLEDLNWLEPFYEKLMRLFVELSHQWDQGRFRRLFEPKLSLIIRYDGEDSGFLKVRADEDCVCLADIQIFQGKGIGGVLIKQIIGLADAADLRSDSGC